MIRDLWDLDNDGSPDSLGAQTAGAPASSATSKANAATGPRIRQTPAGEIVLDGVTRRVVHSYESLAKFLAEGTKRRTTASTNMNAVSSRSHAILTLHVVVTDNDLSDGNDSRRAKLHLVDLAGSERASSTGATGDRLKEGAAINQSLSALGNVINALTKPAAPGTKQFVPYRDSTLTRILQDSIGGNAYTLMICCVSPASVNYQETLSSLRFAQRAKEIKTQVTKNVDPAVAKINALIAESKALRELAAVLMKQLVVSTGAVHKTTVETQMRAIAELPADVTDSLLAMFADAREYCMPYDH